MKQLTVEGISQEELNEIIANDAIELNGRMFISKEKAVQMMYDFVFHMRDEGIIKILKETKGNITTAAKISGIDRKNLYRKIQSLNINPKEFKI